MHYGDQGNSGWQGPPPQGYGPRPQGHRPPPPPDWRPSPPQGNRPRTGGRWGCVVAIIVLIVLVAAGAVALALTSLARSYMMPELPVSPSPTTTEDPTATEDPTTTEEPTATEEPTTTEDEKLYGPEDRPAYKELTDSLDYKIENYKHLRDTGKIYDQIDGKVDEDYVNAFIFTLADYSAALSFGAIGSSYNPKELDDRIHGWQTEIDTLEAKFLKAEELGVSWTITDSSGETKTYEGSPSYEPNDTDDTATVDDPYEFVRNYEFELDDQGTYIKAGEEIAAAFGMTVVYGVADIGNYCPNVLDYGDVLGLYCSATPDIIWIPSDANKEYYPAQFSEPRYIDTIKHEMAHDLITEHCNTPSPPIAGARYEGLTNSYAVLYLGASLDRLQPPDPENVYYMSDETEEWAKQVANGNCG